jgi:hypothetical protein
LLGQRQTNGFAEDAMATTLHNAPITIAQPERKPSTAGSGVMNAIVDACLTVLMSLPVAFRAIVVLVALAVGAIFVYGKYWPPPVLEAQARVVGQSRQEEPGAYTNGRPDPRHRGADSSNPQNQEADHKAAEDAAAFEWHFNHESEDDPKELAIGADTDEQNYIHYRFFEKTDRCVYVKRRANGIDLAQWVRDPRHHQHDYDLHSPGHSTALSKDVSAPSLASTFLLDSFVPVLSAASSPATPEGEGGGSGDCVNPHPGEFRYWWGTPTDKCNSPMYRQFQDGCVHYQIYNRCANAWDARIFWTTCQAGPHR